MCCLRLDSNNSLIDTKGAKKYGIYKATWRRSMESKMKVIGKGWGTLERLVQNGMDWRMAVETCTDISRSSLFLRASWNPLQSSFDKRNEQAYRFAVKIIKNIVNLLMYPV